MRHVYGTESTGVKGESKSYKISINPTQIFIIHMFKGDYIHVVLAETFPVSRVSSVRPYLQQL